MRRLRSFRSTYPPLLWLLGGVTFLNLIGLSFVWPVTSIYIHDQLGRPLTVAGVVLLLNAAGGTLGNLVAGWLFDRVGARPVLLTGLLSSAALVALIGSVSNWTLFVVAMTAYGFAASMPFPAMNALAGRAWPEGGRRTFNFVYVLANAGVAVGTAVGGLLAATSFTAAFLTAAVISLLAAVMVFVGVREPVSAPQVSAPGERTRVAAAGTTIPWLPIGALFVGLLTCWMTYVQWQGPVAVHLQEQGVGLARYSLLWTLNGLIIVVGQPLLSLTLRRLPSMAGQLILGVCLYAGSFALLASGAFYPTLVAGMLCLTLGEMLIHPGVAAAADQLAPPDRRGFLQGFIGSAATMGRMVGPLAGGLVFDHLGFAAVPRASFLLLAAPLLAFGLYALTRKSGAAKPTTP